MEVLFKIGKRKEKKRKNEVDRKWQNREEINAERRKHWLMLKGKQILQAIDNEFICYSYPYLTLSP